MKIDWKWATLAVLVWTTFFSTAHARCYEPNYPIACTTVDGCPGQRDCVGGRPTACVKDDETCPVQHVHVNGIEIIQAIQNINNSVPLVAAKPTIARVYLSAIQPASSFRVTGILKANHGSVSKMIPSTAAVNVTYDTPLRQRRESLPLSLNFVLPADLRASGDTMFTISEIRDTNTNKILNCNNCKAGMTVTFKRDTPLRLRIIGLSYNVSTPTGTITHTPRPVDFNLLISWLRRAYPISTLATTQMTVASTTNPWTNNCVDANGQLAAIRGQDMASNGDQRTHYLGLVSNTGGYMTGCASDIPATANPAIVASSPTGSPTFNAPINVNGDTDATFGDWYGGHELAHTFGRYHPGFCNNNSSSDASFPYPNGQISDDIGTYTGLDFGDTEQSITQTVLPGASTLDIMTYCNQPQWLSAYAYSGILQRLADEDNTFGGPPGAGAALAGSFVHAVATVDLTAQTGRFAYVNPIARTLPQPAGDGRAELVTLTQDGQVISRYPVRLLESTDVPVGEHQTALVDASVPLSPSLGEIQLFLSGKMIASFRASQTKPFAPKEMHIVRDEMKTMKHIALSHTLTWKIPRISKEHITYTVQVSNNGKTWETIGVGIEKTDLALSAEHTARPFIRVIATNGFLSSEPVLIRNPATSKY